MVELKIISNGFEDNKEMPAKYGYSHENINPQLFFEEIPEETKSLVLIMDDPDAPMARPFVHWVVFNIPSNTREIPEGQVPEKAVQGQNDFGDKGYRGPKPPSGTHRYQFKVYALDTTLDLQEGATKQEVLDAIEGHVLGQGQITGLFPSGKA